MNYLTNQIKLAVAFATGVQVAWGMAGFAQAQEVRTVVVNAQTVSDDAAAANGAKSPMVFTTQIKNDGDGPAGSGAAASAGGSSSQRNIIIQSLEPDGGPETAKESTWLGLAAEESPEALSAQLGLSPGAGLTVNYVAKDSPAAKADFHKNDVLVELDGQMLVDPVQLRKLVQMHGEGETIKLTYFRGGKKQTASVKLGKRTGGAALKWEPGRMPGGLPKLQFRVQDLDGRGSGMEDALARAGLDKTKMNVEIQRALEQTTKAIQDSLRQGTSNVGSLDKVQAELEALAHNGVAVGKDATVTVRSTESSQRTMVKTDDSGTIIYEAGAKQHLTARDKHGKTLFDGDIDTAAEQAKVPKAVWEQAQPLIQGEGH